MRLACVLACVAAVAGGPYDEPPGGCQAPPDDFEPPPKPRERAAAVKAPPAAPRPQAPPSEAEDIAEDETLAQQERQLYEQEAADILAEDNEDWDAIEREHLSEMWWRDFVRKVAASLTMAFVAWTVYGRYQQLQRARAEGGAAKADGTIECERKPKRMTPSKEASADAKDEKADAKEEKVEAKEVEKSPVRAKKRTAKAD